MIDWLDEPEGTASIVFEDGSALVRADVDLQALEAELLGVGISGYAARAIARVLATQKMTIARPGYPYRVIEGKTITGAHLEAAAEYLGSPRRM